MIAAAWVRLIKSMIDVRLGLEAGQWIDPDIAEYSYTVGSLPVVEEYGEEKLENMFDQLTAGGGYSREFVEAKKDLGWLIKNFPEDSHYWLSKTLAEQDHRDAVREFMHKAGQEVKYALGEPSLDIRQLRAKLLLEECKETIQALGFSFEHTDLVNDQPFNLQEVIDGCADVKVVATGTELAVGVQDNRYQKLVDWNNLQKFGEGSSKREDGKVVPPPNFEKADVYLKILLENVK